MEGDTRPAPDQPSPTGVLEDADATTADADAAEGAPELEEELDPLAEAQRERDAYLELAQRTQADFDNFRKRAARDQAGAGARAKAPLVRDLLPVVDNLERALAAVPADDQLATGVGLVHSELVSVLSRSGVESFEPSGEAFDPNLHEALSTRTEEGVDAGQVLEVAQRGYRLGDMVLRPARVIVSG